MADRGELISLLLQSFPKEHQSCRVLSLSAKFGARVGLDFCHTKGSYMIATPGGKISSNQIIRHVPIKLSSNLIKIELILLNLEGMDVILDMDWMTRHKVLLDISSRAIESASTLVPMP